MKIYHITNPNDTSTIADKSIIIYNLDAEANAQGSKNLTVLALNTFTPRLDHEVYPQDVNAIDSGYPILDSILSGTYSYRSYNRPKFTYNDILEDERLGAGRYSVESVKLFSNNQQKTIRDCSLFGFKRQQSAKAVINTVSVEEADNIYDKTWLDKRNVQYINNYRYTTLLACPLKTSTTISDDFVLATFVKNNIEVKYFGIDAANVSTVTIQEFFNEVLPSLMPTTSIAQIGKDESTGVVTLEAKAIYKNEPLSNTKIYLDSDAGYLSKTNIITDASGKGILKWSPMLLDAGDKAEIKCGYKFFTNMSNITLEA